MKGRFTEDGIITYVAPTYNFIRKGKGVDRTEPKNKSYRIIGDISEYIHGKWYKFKIFNNKAVIL